MKPWLAFLARWQEASDRANRKVGGCLSLMLLAFALSVVMPIVGGVIWMAGYVWQELARLFGG